MSKKYNLIEICFEHNTNLNRLSEVLVDSIKPELLPTLIALIDNKADNIKVTEEIINHFESIKPAYFDALPQEDRNLVPKNLL